MSNRNRYITIDFKNTCATTINREKFYITGSIELQKGKITLFQGENGSGKSLVAQAIIQLLASDFVTFLKKVDYEGEIINNIKFTKFSIIRQNPYDNFISKCSADEFIFPFVNGLINFEEYQVNLNNILQKAQLSKSILEQNVTHLSSGQAQLLSVCASLAASPDLVVLDESFVKLDSINNKIIHNLLCVAGKKIAFLAATHSAEIFKESASLPIHKSYRFMRNESHIDIVEEEAVVIHKKIPPYDKSLFPENEFLMYFQKFVLNGLIRPDYLTFISGKRTSIVSFQSSLKIFGRKNGYKTVLSEISRLNVGEGMNLLLGQNGSGKTLLGKTLSGQIKINPIFKRYRNLYAQSVDLQYQTKGHIEDFYNNGLSVFVPTEPAHWLSYGTVEDEIIDFTQETETFLNASEITKGCLLENLSYGQKKLTMILSLPQKLKLVILDEPFAGLSVESSIKMRNLLMKRISTGSWKSCVLITNNLFLIKKIFT